MDCNNLELINTWLPVIVFDEHESEFPCNPEQIFRYGKIVANESTYLQPNITGPVYRQSIIAFVQNSVQYIDILYVFFYIYNGPIGCLNIGEHNGDFEHIRVRIYPTHTDVFISQHSGGEWVNWNNLTQNKDGRKIIYVARNSHAMYTSPGRHIRYFGIGNDVCYGTTEWEPDVILYDTKSSNDWLSFSGKWGKDGPRGPFYQKWFNGNEHETTQKRKKWLGPGT